MSTFREGGEGGAKGEGYQCAKISADSGEVLHFLLKTAAISGHIRAGHRRATNGVVSVP